MTFLSTVLFVNVYEIFFCISTAINHECTKYRGMTVPEYALIRNIVNFMFSAIELIFKRQSPFEGLNRENLPIFLARTVSGNICYIGFTFVYYFLPLGIGSTLIACSPFAITLLAYFFLGENVTFFEVAALVVMFSGITLMAMSNPNS